MGCDWRRRVEIARKQNVRRVRLVVVLLFCCVVNPTEGTSVAGD
jgi:hypothetical protein